MKKLNGLMLILLLMTGCAHQTVHDYCVAAENAEHYNSYGECFKIVSEYRAERQYRMSHAFDGMGQQKSQMCSGSSFNGQASWNCN